MSEPVVEVVEIVLFDIAGTRYGADMTQVRRIGRHDETESVGAPLGKPTEGRRALIFMTSGHVEVALAIDGVLGVQSIPRDELRRLPPAAGASPFIIGAWLDRDQPVLLVDLHATNPFRPEVSHA
ncbi:MAG: chemotaxis protein CheW [Myxococcus sp.]|nr:chemotaxis protein CheW [Myxococcus sp.]